jgi:hypothetical protein
MKKSNPHLVRARPGNFVHHPYPLLFQFANPGLDVVDSESEVVDSFTAFFQKRRHGAGWVCRFQKFKTHFADAEETDADLLIGNLLGPLKDSPEGAFIEVPLGVDGTDRDTNVVEGFDGGHDSLL